MEMINREEIKKLAAIKSTICISIYLPTHFFGKETFEGEDMINFKSTIQKIENRLIEKGIKKDKVENMLKPAKELINDTGFWRRQSKGLAVFISDNYFNHYEIPVELTSFELIAGNFHLTPLFPVVFENGVFYLLAFSKDKVRLYTATKYEINEIELEDFVPQGMQEALMYDDPQNMGTLQHHSGQGGQANAMFHGQGAGKDVQKTDVARYLNVVDSGIMKLIKGEQTPLVLAAVDYLVPIYKTVSNYNFIAENAVFGNPEYVNINELHEKAWEEVEPEFKKKREKAILNYKENFDASLVSSTPERIIPAAFYKQVNQLFIEKDANIWGNFNPENNTLEIHKTYKEGDHCLINETAIQSFINGGEVHTLLKEEMPDANNPMSVVLRFA
ncbi:MAG: hypothetical protein H0V01_00140 [Bacteroidetes bacterium]|nr:hypothetical protein [Bacteroidota bacterium]HET6244928.1 hypothetical protein [Bacteroidia bacterium]